MYPNPISGLQKRPGCAESVKSILEYIGVSDCKMQEGLLRFGVNLSSGRQAAIY